MVQAYPKRSRAVKMIYIDYVNGLHGRFLCYAINALDPEIRNQRINVFTDLGTIKYNYPTPLAQADHYSAHHQQIPEDQVISIVGSNDDELLINLLYWHRINEYGFDLKNFNVDFYNKIKGTYLEDMMIDYFVNQGIDPTNNIPKKIFREYFKFDKKPLVRLTQQNPNAKYQLLFRKFYCFDLFINVLKEIKTAFEIPYTINETWYKQLWSKYIRYVYPILEEEARVEYILDRISKKENVPIDLNLVQEAWLDIQIEKLYNVKLELVEDYYTHTKQIIDQL